jgi:hypothetical protein
MKSSRGKFVFIFFLLQSYLLASVELVAPKSFMQGESVQFKIVASGDDVKMPNLKAIENFTVQILGRSVQTHIINGEKSSKIEQTYMFKPDRTVTLPSFGVKIDGKELQTKPQKIQMQKVQKTISDLFDFELQVDKKEVFVGEMIRLDLIFRYKKDINVIDLQFQAPVFDGFWVKKIKGDIPVSNMDSRYHYQGLQYLLFPQKKGDLEIGPLSIKVVTMDSNSANSFFLSGVADKKSVYSNSITIKAKSTPNDVALVGKFQIEAQVDKNEVSQGEAVSFKLKIKGEGNMDDISDIKLDIPQTTIYDNPAKKQFEYKDGKYQGEYSKVFSIVSAQNFTIPPITLEYFDPSTNKLHTIKTKQYSIKVKAPKSADNTPTLQIQKDTQSEQALVSKDDRLLYFFYGLLTMALVVLFVYIVKKVLSMKKDQVQKEKPFLKKLSTAKSKNEILKLVAVYINIDKDLDKIIYQFEQAEDTKELKQLQKQLLLQIKQMGKKGIL